ncbi:MAG: agmatine deiminase family protein [Deltaproteobacteria bacterium]|nr:agmatine deiminase family protein [Deltaproteobacteria bacterium]
MAKAAWSSGFYPFPFWAMDQKIWYRYVQALRGDDRRNLSSYPFKWAYVPPDSPEEAVEFLNDTGTEIDLVSADSVLGKLENMLDFEGMRRQGLVEWRDARTGEEPADGFRMIAEWEPMAGVLLNWPIFYPPLWDTFHQIIAALDHTTTFLRIPEGYLGAAVLAWLEAKGIDLDRVRPIPGPVGDIWARDYSPIYGVSGYSGRGVAHKFSFAAFYPDYRITCRPIVEIDDRFAWTGGFTLRRSTILLDGGSLITNGQGTYVVTRRVLKDNSALPNLLAQLEHWLGARRMIVIDEEPGDQIGHINSLKFIGPSTILVGRPDRENSPISKYYAAVAGLLEREGFEIVDIPYPAGLSRPLPDGEKSAHGLYANCLMINRRLLVARFGSDDYDARALEVYRKALPDYEIFDIDCSVLANGGGAINCSTKEIPDASKASR